jgi:hypothetical protein
MIIFKNYSLENGTLSRKNISDSKHLMWSLGGVPCVNADVWDKWKNRIDHISITTKQGRRFESSRDNFEANKKIIDYGDRQYYLEPEKWA